MKQLTLLLVLIMNFTITKAQFTAIPDTAFEQVLIDLGYDDLKDGAVLTENISSITYLSVFSNNVYDLTGIEDFISLTELYCNQNNLTTLDVSNSPNLEYLYCNNNNLVSLDISNNTLLRCLVCTENNLTNLDISNNPILAFFYCSNNNLTTLDASNNNLIKVFECINNNLINLDVSNNTSLQFLSCENNKLINLDVSDNINLRHIDCSNNNLTSIDIRNGNNEILTKFRTKNNPDLFCITVDDSWFSVTNWSEDVYFFDKNNWAQYTNEICGTNKISGVVYYDENENCTKELSENGMRKIVVKASGLSDYYTTTDILGNYEILVDSNQTYKVNAISFSDLEHVNGSCPENGYEINSGSEGTNIQSIDFGLDIEQCALLSVDIVKDRMRRCFKTNTNIIYKNTGTMDEVASEIFVDYPEYVEIVSASESYTVVDASEKIYKFNIGVIEAFSNGQINIVDSIICGNEEIRGYTQCIKTWITPKSYCAEVKDTTAWDKSSIVILKNAECIGDSISRFTIINHGTGDMLTVHPYRFYYNNELAYTGSFQLVSGDSLVLDATADGSTIRLEADQHPLHPGNSKPRTTIEGCGDNGTPDKVAIGFWNDVPEDDLDYDVSEVCLEIRDSYDPNDKKVSPVGITENKYVPEDDALEYTIRFQNTGTDVAYKIIVVDTLSSQLDISTLKITGASHDYDYSVNGHNEIVLAFTFNDINLPDSTTNEAESHGFISFSISPINNVVPYTEIKNYADIYFDFNSAIRTDTAMVIALDTIIMSDKIITVTEAIGVPLGIAGIDLLDIQIYPNPTNDYITVEGSDNNFIQIKIYDIKGSLLIDQQLQNDKRINVESLAKGVYFIKVEDEEGESYSFKMMKK